MTEENAAKKRPNLISRTSRKVKAAKPERLLTLIWILNFVSAAGSLIVAFSVFINLTNLSEKVSTQKFSLFVIAFSQLSLGLVFLVIEFPLGLIGAEVKGKIADQLGFLFTHRGKAAALFFLSTLSFSASSKHMENRVWHILIGVFILVVSLFSLFVYYAHPTYGEVDLFPETATVKNGGNQTQSRNHQNARMGAANTSSQQNNSFTGSVNQGGYQYGVDSNRPMFQADEYNESPFTIEESDNEFTDFAIDDMNSADKPFLDTGSPNHQEVGSETQPLTKADSSDNNEARV